MSDFVSMPMDKLTNRRNFFSRVEELERNRTRPSAVVQQLSDLGQNTGNLIINGTVGVVNPEEGLMDVFIDQFGVNLRNQQGALFFQNQTNGSYYDVQMSINSGDFLLIENKVGGKGVIISIDDAAHNRIDYSFNDDGLYFESVPLATSGTYTPNIDASSNVTTVSIPGAWSYMHILNTVHVSGAATIDPTAAGTTTVSFSIPALSAFTTAFQASGVASSVGAAAFGNIASTTGDLNITLTFTAVDTASRVWRIMAMYQVI